MGYITAQDRAELEAQKALKQAQLVIANTTLTELAGQPVQSYNFTDGQGSQHAKRRGYAEVMELIKLLESDIAQINRKLNSSGVVSIALRREYC